MRTFTVGTRGSALALWQTHHVTARLSEEARASGRPPPTVDVRVITTRGDTDLSEKLAGKLEKGFFTEELEAELRAGRIDWAVHSLKDLPTRPPEGLVLGAVLARADAFDLLLARPDRVVEAGPELLPLAPGAVVGSSSLRREALLRQFAPDARAAPLRGNVPTRLEKLAQGRYDAIVLAAAGVRRLGLDLSNFAVFELNPRRWPNAPGQGAVAVQCRAGDADVLPLLATIAHAPTTAAVELERAFLQRLEGGCTTPFGCLVADGVAHLGVDTTGGWKHHTVRLPGSGPDEAWIARTLEELLARTNTEDGDVAARLYQRV